MAARGRRPETLRVMVVEDHRSFSDSLGMAIDFQDDLTYVAGPTTIADAVELATTETFDVALVDVHLPDGSGIDAARRLRELSPEAKIIVLTAESHPAYMARAAAAGAVGFLTKTAPVEQILDAVRRVAQGELLIDPAELARLVEDAGGTVSEGGGPNLTKREFDVLTLLGAGMDAVRIADHLGIATSTCRGYIKTLLAKLGVHSQLEAVVKAAELGLLPRG